MRTWALLLAVAALCLTREMAPAADRIRIAAQKTGTFAWELDVIRAQGPSKQATAHKGSAP